MQRSRLLPGTYILNNGPKREGGRFQAGDHAELKRILSTMPGVQVTDKATRADYVILPPGVSGPGSKLLKRGSRFRDPNTWVRMEDVYMVSTGPAMKMAQAYGEPEPSVPASLRPNAEYSRFLNPDYYRQLAEVKDIVTEPAVPSLKRPAKVPIGNEAQTEAWAPPTVMAQATIDRHVNRIDQLLERVPRAVRPTAPALPPPLEPSEVKVKEEKHQLPSVAPSPTPEIKEQTSPSKSPSEDTDDSKSRPSYDTQELTPTTFETVRSFFGEEFRREYELRLVKAADSIDEYLLPDEDQPDDNSDQILDASPSVLYTILDNLQHLARLLKERAPEHKFSTQAEVVIPDYSSEILKRFLALSTSTDIDGFLNESWSVLNQYVTHYYSIYEQRSVKFVEQIIGTNLTLTCQELNDLCVQGQKKVATVSNLADLKSEPTGIPAVNLLSLLWQQACNVFGSLAEVKGPEVYNRCVQNMADVMDVLNYFTEQKYSWAEDQNMFCTIVIEQVNKAVDNIQVNGNMKRMNLMGLLVYLKETGGFEAMLGLKNFLFPNSSANRKQAFQALQLAYGQNNEVDNFYALFIVSMIFVLAQTCNLFTAERLQAAFQGATNEQVQAEPFVIPEQITDPGNNCVIS